MSHWAYYNEFDTGAAQWIKNLIAAGDIAPGEVDTRSIEDVGPDDLRGFTQCHFFAGIAGWSLALRKAGWADSRPIWTGSCPCQPFSAAGKGAGFADERHLWPAFHHLIKERRPTVVLGEQVASKDVDDWIDLVHADLEAMGYAFGSVPFPSAGIGAPHIRDRNYWVAYARCGSDRPQGKGAGHGESKTLRSSNKSSGCGLSPGRLADSNGRHASTEREQRSGEQRQQPEDCSAVRLGHADGQSARRDAGSACSTQAQVNGPNACHGDGPGHAGNGTLRVANDQLQQRQGGAASSDVPGGRHEEPAAIAGLRGDLRPGPTNGFWRDADWLGCRDGKWRPVEPGTFPLVNGLPAGMGALSAGQRRLAEMAGLDAASLKRAKSYRPGALRGFGNAINVEAARCFIECVMDADHDQQITGATP